MKFKDWIKKSCPLLVKNFQGNINVSILESLRVSDDSKNKSLDTDLIIEVDAKTFLKYKKEFSKKPTGLMNGNLCSMEYYWLYNAPKNFRVRAISKSLEVSRPLRQKINKLFKKDVSLDVLLLPFDWNDREEIKTAVNHENPNFSKLIKESATLILQQ